MRKVRALAAVLLLLCLGITQAADGPPLPSEKSGSVLRVGTSGDYPPFSARGAEGEVRGFDAEVAKAYAADRRRPLEFVPFRWPDLQRRLLKGDFDVAMSGVTVRVDRLVQAPMTASVVRTDAVLLTRRGTANVARDWSSLIVGVNRGGHLEQVARSQFPRARIVPVDDNLSLPALLHLGQVDAIVTDTLEAARFQSLGVSGDLGSSFEVAQVLSHDRKAYWVSPKAPGLVEDLDAWLAERETNGSLNRWREEFFGASPDPQLDAGLSRVIDLMGRRLMLMPAVAWAKQAAGRAVEDPQREEVVEQSARRAAREAGLDEGAYMTLVRAQFASAKLVQKAALAAASSHTGRSDEDGQRELVQVLRPAIDRIDRRMLAELRRCKGADVQVDTIAAALRADAPVPGFDDDVARFLAEALLQVVTAGEKAFAPK